MKPTTDFTGEPDSPGARPSRQWQAFAQNLLHFAALVSGGIAIGWMCAIGCASKATLNVPLMGQAAAVIQHNFVNRPAIQRTALTYGAINGMVDALGDSGHSTFLSPEMVTELRNEERGEFKGIGVEIRMKEGRVVVVAPLDQSPAQRAGLRAGDAIVKVNSQDISTWPLSKVVEQITGPAGSKVQLTLMDPQSGHTREVTITRASIKIREITWAQIPGTKLAHLRIASFNGNVSKDLRAALKEILGAKMQGIVLDLRNNPGGILDEAVFSASEFLNGGNVLLIKDSKGNITPQPAKKGGIATDIPLVVLVNKGSASAAEIVAGALRDTRGAELVGETTFGTGTVLGQFDLTDGSALLLAIQEWLTPKGESFWHKGITPGIQVSLPQDVSPSSPESERTMTPAQFQSTADHQLLRAVEILNQPQQPPQHVSTAESVTVGR
jgi:carboxyl-terminal processing protease